MQKPNQFSLLTQKKFLPLFITQFLGAFNDNVLKNAIIILITFRSIQLTTIDPKIMVNLCAGLFILPFFLFSAIAGQLADKFEKSKLIRIIKIFEIILSAWALVGFLFMNLPFLLFTLFLMGSQSAFFGPLKYSILPQHLNQKEILGGNGLVEAGTFLAILFGTIVGGLLVVVNNSGILYVGILCLVVAGIGYYSSRSIPLAISKNENLILNWNILSQSIKSIKLIYNYRLLFLTILAISWFWFYGAVFITQIPALCKAQLTGNEQVVTAILTCFSIGIGLGSLVCEKISKGKIEIGLIAFGAIGLTIFALDLVFATISYSSQDATKLLGFMAFIQTEGSIRILFDIIMIGFAGGIYCVPLYTIMQTRSKIEFRSQVIGANNILNALFMVFAALYAVMIISFGGNVIEIFLITAVINLAIAVYIYLKSQKSVYRFIQRLAFSYKT